MDLHRYIVKVTRLIKIILLDGLSTSYIISLQSSHPNTGHPTQLTNYKNVYLFMYR